MTKKQKAIEKNIAHITNDKFMLVDRDVASYYPRIIINLRLYPVGMGPDFLGAYEQIIQQRLRAKKETAKAAQPQFVVESGFGTNEYLKFVSDDNGLLLTWIGDPNEATQFSSKFAAKERIREIEGLPATRCFKEL